MTSTITGEYPIEDSKTIECQGWSVRFRKKSDIRTVLDNNRYYEIANWIRGLLYVPVLVVFWAHSIWWAAITTLLIITWHMICVVVEHYKRSLICLLPTPFVEAKEGFTPPHLQPASKFADAVYRPRCFESEKLYLSIGCGWVRQVVLEYTQRTKLTPERRAAGEKVDFLPERSGKAILEFEFSTRVGERLHLIGAIANGLLASACFLNQLWWAGAYLVLLVVLDAYLVLLQRFHRVRLWDTVLRLREKLIKPGAVQNQKRETTVA